MLRFLTSIIAYFGESLSWASAMLSVDMPSVVARFNNSDGFSRS
eukprot:SAG31_NODE_42192_length_272_cov_1.439306_1_plen_43_part_01